MTIVNAIWFTPGGTTIGIVLVQVIGPEPLKAYIGVGNGINEERDKEYIASYGTPFPLKAAQQLFGR